VAFRSFDDRSIPPIGQSPKIFVVGKPFLSQGLSVLKFCCYQEQISLLS
jgi:hypothetical protein